MTYKAVLIRIYASDIETDKSDDVNPNMILIPFNLSLTFSALIKIWTLK